MGAHERDREEAPEARLTGVPLEVEPSAKDTLRLTAELADAGPAAAEARGADKTGPPDAGAWYGGGGSGGAAADKPSGETNGKPHAGGT